MAPISRPSRGFTPKYLESLRPQERRYELADPKKPGLRIRVHPTGTKTFRWYVRSLDRVVVLGPWAFSDTPAHLTLKQAHDWLDRLKQARAAGEQRLDAVLAELRAYLTPPKQVPSDADGDTVRRIAEEFYKRRIMPHRKRPEVARRILDLDILPMLGTRPLESVTTRDCATVVERVVDRGAKAHAGKVLALLKQLLRFAQARGYTDRNPAVPLDPKDLGVVNNVTQRWLTDKEIPLFWRVLDRELTDPIPDRRGRVQRHIAPSPATRVALKVLLLTGVRTGELLLARWEEVDLKAGTWAIPVANQKLTLDQAKKGKPFVVPLTPATIALFNELKRLAGKSAWVMASEAEDGHITDKALGRAMRRLFENKHPLLTLPDGPASPHDLRRTMRTHLGKLRVPLHVVERCLNHSLGRIVQTYDQGDYLEERREALEKWAAYVERLVAPDESRIAFLQTERA